MRPDATCNKQTQLCVPSCCGTLCTAVYPAGLMVTGFYLYMYVGYNSITSCEHVWDVSYRWEVGTCCGLGVWRSGAMLNWLSC